jgi:hypothetical protein
MKTKPYPLQMPKDLLKNVRMTARQTGLSTAEAMRQSIKFGLPTLRQRLSAARVTNVEPLPVKIARKLYALPDDDAKAIVRFMNAQSHALEEEE